jgi:hypothetical protein
MSYLPYQKRLQFILSYDQMVRERIAGSWQPYFMTFMFNHIPGKQGTKKRIMTDEVSRVYQTLLPNIVRKPTSSSWKQYCPFFVGCPDLPVSKNEKELVRNLQVNEGLHFNGCLLLPPAEKCRLQEPLDKHFEKHQEQYYWDGHSLARLHATYIHDGSMIDYALKHFKRGNVAYDDILILPRTPSELTGGGVNICPRDQT